MIRRITPLAAGAVFGLGIAISGMANPAKVQNFFDLAGSWDPSLAFVMGGALFVAAIGYRFIFTIAKRPLFEGEFFLPKIKKIDRELVGGAAIFGIGWGIVGFCPGGAIPTLALGHAGTYIFVVAMVAGMMFAHAWRARRFIDTQAAI